MDIADVVIDTEKKEAYRDGTRLGLTHKEFELLLFLARHPGQILSRERILQDVWGFSFLGKSRTIDMHIRSLRRKLQWEQRITTHYSRGYRLDA